MLRAVIRPEWAEELKEDDIIKYNPEHGQMFIQRVDYKELGGLTLALYRNRNDGSYPIYDRDEQDRNVRHASRLDLAFGEPAIVALPDHKNRELYGHKETNRWAARQLENYLRGSSPILTFVGTEKLLLPLAGIALENSDT